MIVSKLNKRSLSMKLSPDQIDNLIYFLLYCVALGIVATFCAALDRTIKYFTRR